MDGVPQYCVKPYLVPFPPPPPLPQSHPRIGGLLLRQKNSFHELFKKKNDSYVGVGSNVPYQHDQPAPEAAAARAWQQQPNQPKPATDVPRLSVNLSRVSYSSSNHHLLGGRLCEQPPMACFAFRADCLGDERAAIAVVETQALRYLQTFQLYCLFAKDSGVAPEPHRSQRGVGSEKRNSAILATQRRKR